MKFFMFNFLLLGVILDMVAIFIVLKCCHGSLLLSQNGKVKKLAHWHDIGLILLKLGTWGYYGF